MINPYSPIFVKEIVSEQVLESYFDRLWPICRSITGNGIRDSFKILQEVIPLKLTEVPTGTKVLDWTVPKEWNISDAYLEDENGNKIIDFKKNNLHIIGYSVPVDLYLTLDELKPHLMTLEKQPTAIPYVTSYYKEHWGFCISYQEYVKLKPGRYHAVIKSELKDGSLTYGDVVLPSTESSKEEILISSYLCHPSMANNELSGPLVTAFLYKALSALPKRRFNYRFYIGPETIGAITYLEKNGEHLKQFCKAGFVATCCGDLRNVTYKKSRSGNHEVDLCTENVLKNSKREFILRSFVPMGSDERQYGSPGFNLPVGVLMGTMFGQFPEYHTSLDNKSFISFDGLLQMVDLYFRCCLTLENNQIYQATVTRGEPMLSKHNLYPTLSSKTTYGDENLNLMRWLLNLCDGKTSLLEIAERCEASVLDLIPGVEALMNAKLLTHVK